MRCLFANNKIFGDAIAMLKIKVNIKRIKEILSEDRYWLKVLYLLLGFLTLFVSTFLTLYNLTYLDYNSWAAYPFIFVQFVWYFLVSNNATTLFRLAFYEEPKRTQAWRKNPPTISIIIPLYKEPVKVLQRFADGLDKVTYPGDRLEMIIVEDSDNDYFKNTVKIFQKIATKKKVKLYLLKRDGRNGYRGGAIKDGIKIASGKYIIVFDIDHNPLPDTFEKMMSVIEANRDRYDVVLFPQQFVKPKNSIANASYIGYRFDYAFSRKGKTVSNSAFCVGTNWIADRKKIVEAGGYDDKTIVEDFATSLKLWHPNGIRIGFAEGDLAIGLLPETLQAWKIQQYRWAYGAFKGFKDYIKSFPKLNIFQKFDYLYNIAWYLVGLTTIMSSLFPLMSSLGAPFLKITSIVNYVIIVVGFTIMQLLLYASPLMIVGEKVTKISQGQSTGILISDTYTLAFIDALRGKKRSFKVTPKDKRRVGIIQLGKELFLPLLLVSINTLVILLYFSNPNLFTLINAFWAAYNNSWIMSALISYGIDLTKGRL